MFLSYRTAFTIKRSMLFLALFFFSVSCQAQIDSSGFPSEEILENELGAFDFSTPVHDINLFQIETSEALQEYLIAIEERTLLHGGSFAAVDIIGDLPNPALPENTSAIEENLLIVKSFPSLFSLLEYSLDPKVIRAEIRLQFFLEDATRFIAETPEEFSIFPSFTELPTREDPAFFLLNAIQFAPEDFPVFEQYFSLATPLAFQAGTVFSAPFSPLFVYEGDFDFAFLALTEWVSLDVFQTFHASEEFLKIVPIRNGIISDFIEASAKRLPSTL